MSQKNTGTNVNGKLLTPENIAYLDRLRAQAATLQPPSANRDDPGGMALTPEKMQAHIAAEEARFDKNNRSRRTHNRLIRGAQAATAAIGGMAFAPGGVMSAGGLGGGGAAPMSALGGTPAAPVTGYASPGIYGSGVVGGGGPTSLAAGVTPATFGGTAAPGSIAALNAAPTALEVAGGAGSGGAKLAATLAGGNRLNSILKGAELATSVGTGIWAAKSQTAADQARLEAELKLADEEMKYQKEKDEQARLDKIAADAEAKRQWDAEQLQKARDSEEARLKWEDSEGRREPYRLHGYNALSHLSGINGLGSIGPRPVRTLPVYSPTSLTTQPYSSLASTSTTTTTPTATKPPSALPPYGGVVIGPTPGTSTTMPVPGPTSKLPEAGPASAGPMSDLTGPASAGARYNWMTGRWEGTPTAAQIAEQAEQARQYDAMGIRF